MTKYFIILFTAFLLYGCSNPGYSARIFISKDAGATEDDIKLITRVLQHTNHEVVMTKEEAPWKLESYKINLVEKRFDVLEHKYIMFVVEYYAAGQSMKSHRTLDKIEVRIGNSWEGRKSILKEEIDQIADQIVKMLLKRFDSSVLSTKRVYTSPV